jgi:hypothetical protein
MDITQHELKTMKAKQLRRLIKEAIKDVLNEDVAADKKAQDSAKQAEMAKLQALQKKKAELSKVASPEEKPSQDAEKVAVDKEMAQTARKLQKLSKPGLGALDLDELAANPKTFSLVNPNMDTTPFAEDKISGVSIADILDFIRDNPNVTEKRIQTHFGFKKPPQVNTIMNALWKDRILNKYRLGNLVPLPTQQAPGEEPEETALTQATEPEDMFMGSGENPLSMYFDDKPNADGEEDFNDSEEPTIDNLEPAELPTPSSDKGKAALFTTDDVNSRLIQSIINNYTTLKSRIKSSSEAGELSGSDMMTAIRSSKAAAELKFPQKMQQLIDKIKEQEPSVQKAILASLIVKFSSVKLPSLAKAIAKELNLDVSIPSIKTPVEEPVVEPEETEEEPLDEWTIRKLQHYAGIIK